MNKLVNQVMSIYKWTQEYTKTVVFEYERFLQLRKDSDKLSPSDDIDKVWHQHILNTKYYYDYCYMRFDKFIHHDPYDSLDQDSRKKRIENTLRYYIVIFKEIPNKLVWKYSDITNLSDAIGTGLSDNPNGPIKNPNGPNVSVNNPNVSVNNPNVSVSNLHEFSDNLTGIKQYIDVKIMYIFDDSNGDNITKKWRKNNKIFDGKTIKFQLDFSGKETPTNLRMRISKKTGHNFIAIKLYHLNKKNITDAMNGTRGSEIFDETKLNQNTPLLAILEEMSSFGYC
jgi:hypothetical protein